MNACHPHKSRWLLAYRLARSGQALHLRLTCSRKLAAAALDSADFRRPLHGGHRDFRLAPMPLRLRLHYWKQHRLRMKSA